MKNLLVLFISIIAILPAMGENAKVKRPETYNYQRGIEATNEGNSEEALGYFYKELEDNPKNGYAHMWIAVLRYNNEEYGKGLTEVDLAIKNLPKKDYEFLASAYSVRARLYLALEDTTKALDDLALAIKTNPEVTTALEQRAQLYYELSQYDLSNADYYQITNLDQGSFIGYMGIGRNLLEQKQWDQAIEQFNKAALMYSDNAVVYSFRAEAYMGKEKWPEATDDIIKALAIDSDDKAFSMMQDLKEPAFSMIKAKMKIQSAKNPNEAKWPYYIGIIHENSEQYEKAIPFYEEANNKDTNDAFLYRMANCYSEIGNYEKALEYINKAIELDSTAVQYAPFKANLYYKMGNYKESIAEWDKLQALYPELSAVYGNRAWVKTTLGDDEGAIEDFTMSIVIDPESANSYMCRGDAYARQGNNELAQADYLKVIEIENSPEKYDRIPFAYQGLGEYEKAVAAMDTIIARDESDSGNYYDAACIYSRMKNKTKALEYLEKSFEMGYTDFNHIRADYDMTFLRDTEEFKTLIEKYESSFKAKTPNKVTEEVKKEEITTEIPFTKESGVCNVKCKINELPLYFVFDTGASTVSLSMVEATFMMKNGYLNKKDVVGSQYFQDANGNVSEGTIINIRQVDFGGLKLENVRASVVRNQKAPLLLGQSVLGRLGKIEIDNNNRILKITHQK